MYVYIYIYLFIVFITEGFLEVAIESWPNWDLNPRPLSLPSLVATFALSEISHR